MKNIFLIVLFILSIGKSFAQDTIIKRSGDTVIAKILEINPIEVKFKKISFLDGPTYVEQKTFIKKINYQGGRIEVFEQEPEISKTATPASDNPDYFGDNSNGTNKIGMWSNGKFRQKNTRLTEKEAQDIFLQTKEKNLVDLTYKAKNARKMQFIGFAAFPLGLVGGMTVITGLLNSQSENYAPGFTCIALAVACPVVSAIYKYKRTSYNTAAVKLYNQRF